MNGSKKRVGSKQTVRYWQSGKELLATQLANSLQSKRRQLASLSIQHSWIRATKWRDKNSKSWTNAPHATDGPNKINSIQRPVAHLTNARSPDCLSIVLFFFFEEIKHVPRDSGGGVFYSMLYVQVRRCPRLFIRASIASPRSMLVSTIGGVRLVEERDKIERFHFLFR